MRPQALFLNGLLILDGFFSSLAFGQPDHFARAEDAYITSADLARQEEVLARIPDVTVVYNEAGIPKKLIGRALGVYTGKQTELTQLLRDLGPAFFATGSESFTEKSVVDEKEFGLRHYRLQQHIAGRPVIGGTAILRTEAATGEVTRIIASFLPDRGLPAQPMLTAADAVLRACAQLEGALGPLAFCSVETEPQLVYVILETRTGNLAWQLQLRYRSRNQSQERADFVFIDSQDGAFLRSEPTSVSALHREVYTANNIAGAPPYESLFSEGESSSDLSAWLPYVHAGATYNYFSSRFGRDSFDNAGGIVHLVAHYPLGNNADYIKYNGQNYLRFGDGNGNDILPFGRDLDVVAHEFSHAFHEYSADFFFGLDEAAALAEGLSDTVSASTNAWIAGVNPSTWVMADTVWRPNTSTPGNRDLSYPTRFGDMDYYPSADGTMSIEGSAHKNERL